MPVGSKFAPPSCENSGYAENLFFACKKFTPVCKTIDRQVSPASIWLPIVPAGAQIEHAGIHIAPACKENVPTNIEIIQANIQIMPAYKTRDAD